MYKNTVVGDWMPSYQMHQDSAFELIRITTASTTWTLKMSTYRKVLENDQNGLQGP